MLVWESLESTGYGAMELHPRCCYIQKRQYSIGGKSSRWHLHRMAGMSDIQNEADSVGSDRVVITLHPLAAVLAMLAGQRRDRERGNMGRGSGTSSEAEENPRRGVSSGDNDSGLTGHKPADTRQNKSTDRAEQTRVSALLQRVVLPVLQLDAIRCTCSSCAVTVSPNTPRLHRRRIGAA